MRYHQRVSSLMLFRLFSAVFPTCADWSLRLPDLESERDLYSLAIIILLSLCRALTLLPRIETLSQLLSLMLLLVVVASLATTVSPLECSTASLPSLIWWPIRPSFTAHCRPMRHDWWLSCRTWSCGAHYHGSTPRPQGSKFAAC